jgi:hypothetical protein
MPRKSTRRRQLKVGRPPATRARPSLHQVLELLRRSPSHPGLHPHDPDNLSIPVIAKMVGIFDPKTVERKIRDLERDGTLTKNKTILTTATWYTRRNS